MNAMLHSRLSCGVLVTKLLLFLIFVGALSTHAKSSPNPGASTTKTIASLDINGTTRWFSLFLPTQPASPPPIVVVLHGGGQSMHSIFGPNAGGTSAWPVLAEKHGFLLLAPNGVDAGSGDTNGDSQNWNDFRTSSFRGKSEADDVTFINMLVDHVATVHGADRSRIYLTGASNGGMMTHRLLVETPERYAAAATFIAALPDGVTLPPPTRPTPLMMINGTRDPLVNWNGGEVRLLGARGRGRVMSAHDTLAWWIAANRAGPATAQDILPDLDPKDGCRIYSTLHPAAEGGAPVLFLKVEGVGHALPSRHFRLPDTRIVRRYIGPVCRDAEGAELAWQFLSSFHNPGGGTVPSAR